MVSGVISRPLIAFFMLAVPVSSVIGVPLSGLLLNVTGLGMEGWQWLFILEGVPSVLLSIAVLFYLTDFPRDAGGFAAMRSAGSKPR